MTGSNTKEELYTNHFQMYKRILKIEGDRGAVLTVSAFIEHELSEIMKKRFTPPNDMNNDDFFNNNGVLRNFDSKLKFAYRFHILSKIEFDFINGFRSKIRNKFAHEFEIMNIEDMKDKLLGIIRNFPPLNDYLKQVLGSSTDLNALSSRTIFDTAMALIMTDLKFWNLQPNIFKM